MEISTKLLKSVIQKSLRFFVFLRPLLHSRWNWICISPFYRFHGGMTILMGAYLALPLPIPFSNLLAAWSLLLLGLGLIEEDGLFICLSYLLGCTAIFLLGWLIDWLRTWIVS